MAVNDYLILELIPRHLELALLLAAPLAGVALVAGLAASILETATSIHEHNLEIGRAHV